MKNPDAKSRRSFIKNSVTGGAVLSTVPITGFGLSGKSTSKPTKIHEPAPRIPCSIYMASNLDTDFETRVRNISNQITLLKDLQGQSQLEALNQADIHFGQIKKEQFGQTKNLSWVQSVSAGVEHQLYPEFKDSEVVLTNAKGCYAPAIAEHTIGLLFSLTRQIGSQVRRMSEHQWGGSGDQIEMKNLTMGIVGFGGIGRQVARRARAMDMRILAADIQGFYKEQIGDICDELYHISEGGLEDLLEQSDVVVCAAPHTPVSEGMFGEKQFERMKSGAYFINVSRGKLVDTDALQAALESGHLAGAGLDVTNPEPLPAEHPLWDFENVTITSHISGRSQHSWERLQAVFVENVNRYINGQPLINTVDKEAGF